jgi:hypothetical protein
VCFLGEDIYDPLGLTGVRVANFLFIQIFHWFFYTDLKIVINNEKFKKIYLDPMLQLRLGSGLAPAPLHYIEVQYMEMVWLLLWTPLVILCSFYCAVEAGAASWWSLGSANIDFLWLRLPNRGFMYIKSHSGGANDVYGHVSKAEPHPEQHCWIWSLILWWLLSPVFSWFRSPMFRWLQPYLEMAPAVALMFNIESWSQGAGAG